MKKEEINKQAMIINQAILKILKFYPLMSLKEIKKSIKCPLCPIDWNLLNHCIHNDFTMTNKYIKEV